MRSVPEVVAEGFQISTTTSRIYIYIYIRVDRLNYGFTWRRFTCTTTNRIGVSRFQSPTHSWIMHTSTYLGDKSSTS